MQKQTRRTINFLPLVFSSYPRIIKERQGKERVLDDVEADGEDCWRKLRDRAGTAVDIDGSATIFKGQDTTALALAGLKKRPDGTSLLALHSPLGSRGLCRVTDTRCWHQQLAPCEVTGTRE